MFITLNDIQTQNDLALAFSPHNPNSIIQSIQLEPASKNQRRHVHGRLTIRYIHIRP